MPENNLSLLSKCVERRYAEMLFYEGVLHFGYPSKWIEEGTKGNVGQGDELEGVYSNEITPEIFGMREDVDDTTIEGAKYLRSRRIVNWPCYCLYSISEQTEPIGREGDYVVYDMSDAYAQDFSGEETWENRFKTEFPGRKAMVVIHRPQAFLDKVKRRFADFKLEEGRDYYMGCVQYRKEGERFTYKEVPTEMFHKDAPKSKYQATISGGRIMAPRGGYKTIVENEEKDSYFYLRKYGGGESSWFEGVIVHTPEGVKEYTHLTYDVEGLVGPLVHRRNSR